MLVFPKAFAAAVYCTFASEDMDYGDLGWRGEKRHTHEEVKDEAKRSDGERGKVANKPLCAFVSHW